MSHDHYHFGGLADNAGGGQIHLPIVSFTINSGPPTSTEQLWIAPRELPGMGAPDGASLYEIFGRDQENTATEV